MSRVLLRLAACAVFAGALPMQPAFAQTVTVSIEGAVPAAVNEGDTVNFAVRMSAAQAVDVTVPYAISGTGITADDVHGALTGNEVVIPRGDVTATIAIYVLIDGTAEAAAETLTVTLSAPTVAGGGTAPSLGTATTANAMIAASTDTMPPTADTVTVTAAAATGTAPGGTATFTVAISGFREVSRRVYYEVLAGATSPAAPRHFRGALDNDPFPRGDVIVDAGTAREAAIELELAPANTVTSGGTYNYAVRILSTARYDSATDATVTTVYDATTRPTDADGTITIPATAGVLRVLRPDYNDIAGEAGAPSLTLREELSQADRRRINAQGRDPSLMTSPPSTHAVFVVNLTDSATGATGLQASAAVTFTFSISGDVSAILDEDYRAPRLDSVPNPAARITASGGGWQAVIPAGVSGLTIAVPIVDDDTAEDDESIRLTLTGTPVVAAGGGSVTLPADAASGLSSLDYTITGAEPASVVNPAGTLAITATPSSEGIPGRQATFTFTLSDDDDDEDDETEGADETYRIWYNLRTSSTAASASAGQPHFEVRPDNDKTFYFSSDASNPHPLLVAGRRHGTAYPIAGTDLTGANVRGYGWVLIDRGGSEVTLDVGTVANVSNLWIEVSALVVDSPDAGDVPHPTVDFTQSARASYGDHVRAASGAASIYATGISGGAVSEGAATKSIEIKTGGMAPSGGVSMTSPVVWTWTLRGTRRIGNSERRTMPLSAADVTITSSGDNVGADSNNNIIAQRTMTYTGAWTHDATIHTLAFSIDDDALAEGEEGYSLTIASDRPAEISEYIGASEYVTDSAGDHVAASFTASPAAEAHDEDAATPARFRLTLTASSAMNGRPQAGAIIPWRVQQSTDSAHNPVTPSDFLQCRNDTCSETGVYSSLPRGIVQVPADETGDGPWHYELPFIINDDGAAEAQETFVIAVNGEERFINLSGSSSDTIEIAASASDNARLVVTIGDAMHTYQRNNVIVPIRDGRVEEDFRQTNDAGEAAPYASQLRGFTTVRFPLTFSASGSAISAANQPRLNGPVRVRATIGGTIFANGALPSDAAAGATIGSYPRAIERRFPVPDIAASWRAPLYLAVNVPMLDLSDGAIETLTVTLSSVAGNGGAVSVGAAAAQQGSVNIIGAAGRFSIAHTGAGAASATVAEEVGAVSYTVTYTGNQLIPDGGVTLDWTVAAADSDNPGGQSAAVPADFGDGTDSAFPMGDGAIHFAAGTASGSTQTFTVAINNDNAIEGTEFYTVALGGVLVDGVSDAAYRVPTFAGKAVTLITDTDAERPNNVFTISGPVMVEENDAADSIGITYIATYASGRFSSAICGGGITLDWTVAAAAGDNPGGLAAATAADFDQDGDGVADSGFPSGNDAIFPRNSRGCTAVGATQSFTVRIFNDPASEGAEYYTVTISDVRNNRIPDTRYGVDNAANKVVTTINASDVANTFAISPLSNSVTEGGGAITYTVTYSGAGTIPSGGVTLDWIVAAAAGDNPGGQTPAVGSDFDQNADGMPDIVFPRGDDAIRFAANAPDGSTQTFTVAIHDDSVAEGDEYYSVALDDVKVDGAATASYGVSATAGKAVTTINRNDGGGGANSFSISPLRNSVAEGDGTVSYTVTYIGEEIPAGGVTLDWTVAAAAGDNPGGQTAADAADFGDGTSGAFPMGDDAIVFVAGAASDSTQVFTVAINNDTAAEGAEYYSVALGDVKANGAATTAYSVSATAGKAVTTIMASDISASFAIAANSAAGKTVDRDVNTAGLQVNEGDTVYFSVIPEGSAPTGEVTVQWAPTGDTATTGATLTFAPANWATAQEVTVVAADDTINEGEETLGATLSSASGGVSIATASATVAVPANDPITYSIRRDPATVFEGDPGDAEMTAAYTVTLSGATESAWDSIGIPYTIEGAATQTEDYTLSPADSVTFTGTDLTQAVTATVVHDNLNESSEALILRFGSTPSTTGSGGGTVNSSGILFHTVGIRDDDAITATLSPGTVAIAEGESATLTMTMDHASAAATTLSYAIAAAAGTPGGVPMFTHSGGTGAMGSIVIAAGDTMGTFTLTSPPDGANDSGTGTLTVSFGTVTTGTGGGMASGSGTAVATVSYRAFERSFAVAVDDATAAEGGTATFTVELSGATAPESGMPATVFWALSGVDENDYTSPASASGVLSFTALASQSVVVAIADDNRNEGAETLTFTLSGASGGGGLGSGITTASATVAIAASDPIAAAVSAAATSVTEGGTATLTVNLGAVPTTDVTVAYAIGATDASDDVDAVAADDLTDTSDGSIVIRAASDPPSGAIRIGIDADNRNESAETFTVTIADGDISGHIGAATVASGGAQTFTIAASDPMSAAIAAPAPATVSEGRTAIFTVELTGASAGSAAATTVSYTVGGTTTDTPTDANSGSIVIAAGQTRGTIPIGIPTSADLGDSSPDQMLTVTLDTVATAAGGGAVTAADTPGNAASVAVNYLSAMHFFSFTDPATSIAEGTATATTYTVTRAIGPALTGNILVTWGYTAGGTEAADFAGGTAPAGGTLTFTGASGRATAQTFAVTTAADTLNEGDEAFTLALSVADATAEGGIALPSELGVTITDDDTINVAIATGDASVAEDGSADFTVTLSGGTRTADVVVPFTAGGLDNAEFDITAPSGIDAAALGGSVTFAAADTTVLTATITVDLQGDSLNEASETLTITGGAATSAGTVDYTSGGRTATATVTDDDPLEAHLVLSNPATGGVNEGGSATYTVTLRDSGGGGGTSAGIVCVPFSVVVNGQQNPSNNVFSGADIALVAPHNVTCADRNTVVTPATADGSATASVEIPAGQSSAAFQIQARDDGIDEGATDETISVTLGTPVAGAGAGAVTANTAAASVNINSTTAAMRADVNDDGRLDRNDAAIMYYAYAVRGLDADNTSDADLRHLLLRGLMPRSARGNDTAYQTALRLAAAWRAMGPAGGRDINGDGRLDRNDAAIMYYAYAVRGLDADNTSDADLRHLLLRGLMPRSARGNDTEYQRALALALQFLPRMPQ